MYRGIGLEKLFEQQKKGCPARFIARVTVRGRKAHGPDAPYGQRIKHRLLQNSYSRVGSAKTTKKRTEYVQSAFFNKEITYLLTLRPSQTTFRTIFHPYTFDGRTSKHVLREDALAFVFFNQLYMSICLTSIS